MNSFDTLHFEKITVGSPYTGSIKRIGKEAFTSHDDFDFDDMLQFQDMGFCDFLAVIDGEVAVGLVVLVNYAENVKYLLYLAIDSQCRGCGYGSRAMKLLTAANEDNLIALCVEAPLPDAENYQQRLKRIKFYERCGFTMSDKVYGRKEDEFYSVMSNRPDIDSDIIYNAIIEKKQQWTKD